MTSRSIVVGFDGSSGGRAAVRWAAGAAALAHTRLRIVHAVGLLEHGGLRVTDLHRAAAIDDVVAAGLAADQVEWCRADGDPCSVLLRACEPPDEPLLLVVGSRGTGARGGTRLGSTSLELVEHSRVPVTVVPNLERTA
jgi:nucleotide-binding universal stress UspA family protein